MPILYSIDRISKRMVMDFQHLGDKKLGIFLYRNVIQDGNNIPSRLEKSLSGSTHELFTWRDAVVGYNQKMPEYRDCVDLKMSPAHWPYLEPRFADIKECYEDTELYIKTCLTHYQSMFNISMEYMEAINFVRYTPGQHFNIHTDHGFSYSCTVSSILYLNDDYEGGELWFPYLDIIHKPKSGDVLLFPSTYIYAHASLKVKSGTKYAAVTMFDYNDNNHRYPGYGNDGSEVEPTAGITKTVGRHFTFPEV
jgi:predicted 2-oxoglutarate/Fe(II)-dependent dioxygenase YbiX